MRRTESKNIALNVKIE